MILYTLYSSMSVFICISSLPAPFCSWWFHLQASEMMLFVTITIPNIVFYWAMVLHVQFLPMNFFFFCVSPLLSSSHYLEILSKYNHIYIMADNIDQPKKSIH